MSRNLEIIFSMFWNFIKNSKKQKFEKSCFQKLSNYATIRPALLGLSQAIYAKTAFMCQISRKIPKC